MDIKKYKLQKWLSTYSKEENKTLFRFTDDICMYIYTDLKRNNLDLNIPYKEFKKRIIMFLFNNTHV